jgi:hypothetical protein
MSPSAGWELLGPYTSARPHVADREAQRVGCRNTRTSGAAASLLTIS